MDYQMIETQSDAAFTAQAVALLQQKITESLAARGECILGLSGGSTPRPVYEALGKEEGIDWSKIKLFLADERYVPAKSAESNQKLVHDTLLKNAAIPANQCYFPDTSLPIEACVIAYTEALVHLLREHAPDCMTLGLGNDGHIASLFPPVAEDAFGEVIALHTTTGTFAVRDRISVSPLVIMSAQSHLLLLKGAEKKKVFEECVKAEPDPVRFPLQIALATGRTVVVLQ
ncbi:MAG: 6-phosphogluconolactonase [Candidatus Peribacteraceae bacterium]|nr:6-phosphogluconolactonase [Candidatus Peribacteraceae bacterium]